MSIPTTVTDFLASQETRYDVVKHPLSMTSQETAQAAHVSGECVAKAVVLKDDEGFVIAVLPATHTVHTESLGKLLGRKVELAEESDFVGLFTDCAPGAVPAVGQAYQLDTVVDVSLYDQSEIYFEAGDHEDLIHVSAEQFKRLMRKAAKGAFSHHKT